MTKEKKPDLPSPPIPEVEETEEQVEKKEKKTGVKGDGSTSKKPKKKTRTAEQLKKDEAIEVTTKAVEKMFGRGTIMDMGSKSAKMMVEVIPTGSLALDEALTIGGYPRGRVVEIYGPEACLDGDTFISYNVRTEDGRKINCKGGTIKCLWERFHGESASGDGRGEYLQPTSIGAKFTAPSLDEAKSIFHNEIVDVVKTGTKECFELTTLGGYSITATAEHKFFTGEQWVGLAELSPGDTVIVHNNFILIAVEDIVSSIVPVGERNTFDLKMTSPFNNYVANNFVVHNSGKTTLTLHAIAEAQKKGGRALFIDAEHALDVNYAAHLGVKMDELLLSQPDYGEQALEVADMMVRSSGFDIIVIDSVAALVPKAELEGEMGSSHMGLQARLMSQALRKLTSAVGESKTTVIFINQIRQKIGNVYGNPEVTTGGNALKFYCSVRLDIRSKQKIKDGDKLIGHETVVKVVKNKMAPPFREAKFDVIWGEGISRSLEILSLGIKHEIVEQSGSYYSYGDVKLGQGKVAVKNFFDENPDVMEKIRKEIRKAMGLAA